MGYTFYPEHSASLCRALNDLRWKFSKGEEYPDMGPFHPNLLIETAIDEIEWLASERKSST